MSIVALHHRESHITDVKNKVTKHVRDENTHTHSAETVHVSWSSISLMCIVFRANYAIPRLTEN